MTNRENTITTPGTLEEVVTRIGFDESALFVHVRFPNDVRKIVLTCPTNQVLTDNLCPDTDILLHLTEDGTAEYGGLFTPPHDDNGAGVGELTATL